VSTGRDPRQSNLPVRIPALNAAHSATVNVNTEPVRFSMTVSSAG
jgi:hypothetical protein